MSDSMKDKVINYFQVLMGECGYLLTTDCVYQYVSYAETEDELILDVYEELPEELWSTRHHIPKNKIIAHFKNTSDLGTLNSTKYLKWKDLETTKRYKCSLNGNIYEVQLFSPTSCDTHQWEVRLISDNVWHFILEEDKQFFDDLHLVVIE